MNEQDKWPVSSRRIPSLENMEGQAIGAALDIVL
jgi:hypothetical protein